MVVKGDRNQLYNIRREFLVALELHKYIEHETQHKVGRQKQLALALQIKCITIYASMVTRAGHKYLQISLRMVLYKMMN